MSQLEEQLRAGLCQLGLELPREAFGQLLRFVDELARWNRAQNLTAVREPGEMLSRHVLDSLAVAGYLHGRRILDVGSGAGLPGIPLAVAVPGCEFALLDARSKRVRFLRHAIACLGLANVTVVKARVEDYRPPQGFDTVIARAFASLSRLIGLAGHLCVPEGRVLAMKGVFPQAELEDLPEGWLVERTVRLSIPGLAAERHLVIAGREKPI